MEAKFVVKAGEFAGPLEVLLRLIEERKLHISQVALAQVADEFIGYMKSLDQNSKGQIADFILIASTLMLIKSLSLLPTLAVTEEEKGNMEDLERRLRLYQQTKELAQKVKELYGKNIIFAKEYNPAKATPVFAPTREITIPNLVLALKTVINNLPKTKVLPQVLVKKVISLEEVIKDLTERIKVALKTSFKDFVKDKGGRVNVIVSFLGLLEMAKQGVVELEQTTHFDDISIQSAQN